MTLSLGAGVRLEAHEQCSATGEEQGCQTQEYANIRLECRHGRWALSLVALRFDLGAGGGGERREELVHDHTV